MQPHLEQIEFNWNLTPINFKSTNLEQIGGLKLDFIKYINLYNLTMKSVQFRGKSLDDLRSFPATAMREAGFQIDRIQHGFQPDDFKPMPSVGSAAAEIRIWDEAGTFRVIYVAKFADAVYVLHCFQKKTQKTPKKDIDLATKRYKDLIKEIAS